MRQDKPINLSIVMPVFKQEKYIVANLRALESELKKLNITYEIICVVDGFEDRTFEKAKTLKSKNVKIIGYRLNHGKGYAVRLGMTTARGNIIGYVDCGDLDYTMIPMLLEHFRWYGADAMIASKRHPVSQLVYPWQRRLLSLGYQLGVKVLFGLNVRDTQVGMKLFSKRLVKKVLPLLVIKEFAFDIEILAVAHHLGFKKIFEAPVKLKLDFSNNSTIISAGFLKTAFKMAWDTVAVFYRLRILHYYDDKNK